MKLYKKMNSKKTQYNNLPYDFRTRQERMELWTLKEKICFGIIIGSLVVFLLGSILQNYGY